MHLGLLLLADATVHEKSKVAFYICGGLLAAWAVLASFFSFSRPDFPRTAQHARATMGVSAALVAATLAAAVLTASTPAPAPAYARKALPPKGTAPAPTSGGTSATPGGGPAAAAGGAAAGSAGAARGAAKTASGGLSLAADPTGQLKFDKTSLSTKAGK